MSEIHTASRPPLSKAPSTRSGIACVAVPGIVVTGAHFRGLMPSRPCRRIEAATVLRFTTSPSRARAAVIRGAPSTPSDRSCAARTASSTWARRMACGPGPAARRAAQA